MEVYLKEPNLEDYWYEQKVLKDSLTMAYNAGWDVTYDGYDYDTGCISFPKEKWKKDFERRKEGNRYFAYVVNKDNNEFVGYVNFQYNNREDKYTCGVVIEHCHRGMGYGKKALRMLCEVAFNEYDVKSLYDDFEEGRNSVGIFTDIGFKKVSKRISKRFGKDITIIEVCLKKEDFC